MGTSSYRLQAQWFVRKVKVKIKRKWKRKFPVTVLTYSIDRDEWLNLLSLLKDYYFVCKGKISQVSHSLLKTHKRMGIQSRQSVESSSFFQLFFFLSKFFLFLFCFSVFHFHLFILTGDVLTNTFFILCILDCVLKDLKVNMRRTCIRRGIYAQLMDEGERREL